MQYTIIGVIHDMADTIVQNRLYLSMILIGALLVLAGMYVSIYRNSIFNGGKRNSKIKYNKYLKCLEYAINKFPLNILSKKLDRSISYFMLEEWTQRKITVIFTLIIPIVGILMYIALNSVINLWYTRLITFLLCLMVPYYVFTLLVDYMKYNLRLKIPLLIDSFRSSFMIHYRIKPALYECSKSIDKTFGRIIGRLSDSSDLNHSLCIIRDKINDNWFNVFILLLVNYRENGGELVAQLYKLNRTITRYNNIEKKKNKRLIWYEVFTVAASIFSLPAIILLNKTILGFDTAMYYDAASSFARIVVFSLGALLIVRLLRRM